jgi:hypothetical protein
MLQRIVIPLVLSISCSAWPIGATAGPPAITPAQMLEIEILDARAGSAKPATATLMVSLDGSMKGTIDSGGEIRRCEVSNRSVDAETRLHVECIAARGSATPSGDISVSAQRIFPKGRRVVVASLEGANGRRTEIAVTAR